MIKGFEEFTPDVDANDLEVIKIIVYGLRKKVGKEKAITNAKIREALLEKFDIKLTDSQMRKYIQYIRIHRLVDKLCASAAGYYVAANEHEFNEYVSSLRQRTRSLLFTLSCLNEKLEIIE
jgi:hypothetical protein